MSVAQPIFFVLLICPFFGATAQEYITVRGSVIDNKSKGPLPYVSITVKGRAIGSVTNSEGNFEFHIPGAFASDTVYVSHIGYKTLKFSIEWLSKSPIGHFALDEDVVMLEEVVVTADMAKSKVEQAFKALQANYPTQPYLMEAFYRSWEMVDFTDSISYPGTIVESALIVYDPGYKNAKSMNEKTYTKDIRRSKLMAGWNYNKGSLVGERLFRENHIKYGKFKAESFLTNFLDLPNDLEYKIEDVVKFDGEDVAVITVDIPNSRNFPAVYKIYVSQADNAILKFTLTGRTDEVSYKLPYEFNDIEHLYIFKRYKGRCYLSYAKVQYRIKKIDLSNHKVLQVESYYNELLVSNIITDSVEQRHKNYAKTLGKKSPILASEKYNVIFWNNYNTVLENPIDKAILETFEKTESLEKQYEKAESEYRKLNKRVPRRN